MNAEFKINGVVLETKRLILRPFKESDLNDFYGYASIDGVGEMAGWPHHDNIETTKNILEMFIKDDNVFAIVSKEDDKVIGSLGVEKYSNEEKLIELKPLYGREIGYVLSKDYWGQGLMTEAVNKVIDYLFVNLNYDFLLCGYFLFNNRSKRVQEKCGFEFFKKVEMNTFLGGKEEGVINLLLNKNKDIKLSSKL